MNEMEQKCIRCGKPATVNVQKLWVKWDYDAENDEYSQRYELLDIEPSEGENLHLCRKCFEEWRSGGIMQ